MLSTVVEYIVAVKGKSAITTRGMDMLQSLIVSGWTQLVSLSFGLLLSSFNRLRPNKLSTCRANQKMKLCWASSNETNRVDGEV